MTLAPSFYEKEINTKRGKALVKVTGKNLVVQLELVRYPLSQYKKREGAYEEFPAAPVLLQPGGDGL